MDKINTLTPDTVIDSSGHIKEYSADHNAHKVKSS